MPKNRRADLVLENANVVTCGPGMPGPAQAIAVQGERILRVGTNSELESLKGKGTAVIDCNGQTLLPGFNDAHCHFFALAKKLLTLDLSPNNARSIRDIQRIIRGKTATIPPGTWVRGSGYNEFYLAEKRHPTRHDLDGVAPCHPVVLIHRSFHACVLNTLAMGLAGITNETPEPPGGVIERELATGEPNGVLYEMEDFVRSKIPSTITEADMDSAIREASTQLVSLGITSLGDATFTNSPADWETFWKLKRQGKIASRIYMMFRDLCEMLSAGLKPLDGDHNVRLGSWKIVISEATGRLHPSQAELNEIVARADAAGFQVALHAVERTVVEAAVVALEQAAHNRSPGKANPRRHRVEHCSECPPELVTRLKKVEAVIASQPPFVYFNGERYLADVAPPVQQILYPFRSLQKARLILAASSDAPVVPANPLAGIYAAVTRLTESDQILLSQEGVSPAEALNMYTINSAYASFAEKEKGILAPGKLADIVMLSGNPLTCPPAQLKDLKVEMTLVGGEVVWEKGAYQ